MRRPKEDAQQTKEKILEEAFNCFFENGFEGTSLEAIAQRAYVTRGAVYWHFTDKEELYRQVVNTMLNRADIVSAYAYRLDPGLSYHERIYEVFWFAMNNAREVDFVYKTLNFVSQREGFNDILESIQYEKIKLYRYFVEETRVYLQNTNRFDLDPEELASGLFLLFEGLFLTKHISVGVKTDRESIQRYIDLVLNNIN